MNQLLESELQGVDSYENFAVVMLVDGVAFLWNRNIASMLLILIFEQTPESDSKGVDTLGQFAGI